MPPWRTCSTCTELTSPSAATSTGELSCQKTLLAARPKLWTHHSCWTRVQLQTKVTMHCNMTILTASQQAQPQTDKPEPGQPPWASSVAC